MDSAEKKFFDNPKLMVSLIERLKRDIENNDPNDSAAKDMVNELLYHYCWKMVDAEKDKK